MLTTGSQSNKACRQIVIHCQIRCKNSASVAVKRVLDIASKDLVSFLIANVTEQNTTLFSSSKMKLLDIKVSKMDS